MKVHELITMLSQCPPECDVEIACGPMIADAIAEVEIPVLAEETCFIFGAEDPEIMDDDCAIIGRLSDLIASHQARL